MSGEDIKKIFEKDSKDKKRIGSNVHRMSGKGKKGGLKYGVLLGKSVFDKPYSKNSKTESVNIKEEVCSYEKLTTFTEVQQKFILEQWLDRLSYNKIAIGLGISRNKLRRIMDTLDISKKSYPQMRGQGIMEEFNVENFRADNFNKYKFNKLDDFEKYQVVDNLRKVDKLSNKDIGKMLDIRENSVSVYISNWKKEWNRLQFGGEGEHIANDYLEQVDSFNTADLKLHDSEPKETSSSKEHLEEKTVPIFNYNLRGTYDGKELAEELNEIAEVIRGYSDITAHIKIKK
ncbi:hypothetical protein [Oceanobacillus oncorhynchi]|uniref:hypothetical protein n=1 Tax=Oceanobacillus oncorhynchi TaxID=545501 RepID=UPI0034D4315B